MGGCWVPVKKDSVNPPNQKRSLGCGERVESISTIPGTHFLIGFVQLETRMSPEREWHSYKSTLRTRVPYTRHSRLCGDEAMALLSSPPYLELSEILVFPNRGKTYIYIAFTRKWWERKRESLSPFRFRGVFFGEPYPSLSWSGYDPPKRYRFLKKRLFLETNSMETGMYGLHIFVCRKDFQKIQTSPLVEDSFRDSPIISTGVMF